MNEEELNKLKNVKMALAKLRPEKEQSHLQKSFMKLFLDTSDIMLIFQIGNKTAYRWRKLKLLNHEKVRGICLYTWGGILDLIDDRLFGNDQK